MRCHLWLERLKAKKGKGWLHEMENKGGHYNGTIIWTVRPYRKSIPALDEHKVKLSCAAAKYQKEAWPPSEPGVHTVEGQQLRTREPFLSGAIFRGQ